MPLTLVVATGFYIRSCSCIWETQTTSALGSALLGSPLPCSCRLKQTLNAGPSARHSPLSAACRCGKHFVPEAWLLHRPVIIWLYCVGTLLAARLGEGFSFGGIASRIAFLDGYRCSVLQPSAGRHMWRVFSMHSKR